MNIDLQDFLRGVFVMKATIKEQKMFFQTIMNHVPNDISNFKLLLISRKWTWLQ